MNDFKNIFLSIYWVISKSFLKVCFVLNSRTPASIVAEEEEIRGGAEI